MAKEGTCNKAVIVIIAVNITIFLLIAMVSGLKSDINAQSLFYTLALSRGSVLQHPWSIMTYMFTQVNIFHLAINMAWLYVFGNIAGKFVSRITIISLYIGGGLLAAFVFIIQGYIFPTDSILPLTGASAAVLSIVGASAIITPNYNAMVFGNNSIKLKWIGGAAALTLLLLVNSGHKDVALIHLSGLMFGIIAGVLSKRKFASGIERAG